MLRGVVAGRRFAQARGYDFAAAAQKLSSVEAKKALSALRSKHDEVRHSIAANAGEVPPIDWAYYKANISDQALVAQFEKDWNAIVAPTFTDQTEGKTNESLSALLSQAETMKNDSIGRVGELEAIVKELTENKTDRDTTFAEIEARFPEITAEAEDEMKKEEYYKDTL